MDENKAQATVLASIMVDKHARKMAEHAQCMAELGIKKQWIDIEANRKRLEAKDRRLAAQYQRKRKKEQHDMQMLCLHLQYQGGSGITGCAAPAAQFVPGMEGLVSPSAFEDMGTEMGGNYLM
jgi:hypothetical protein